MQLGVWGALNLPPAGPGQKSGGVQGARPLRNPEIWHFKVQNTDQKLNLWFSFLVQNDFKRKDHPFDVPNKANYTFARI